MQLLKIAAARGLGNSCTGEPNNVDVERQPTWYFIAVMQEPELGKPNSTLNGDHRSAL